MGEREERREKEEGKGEEKREREKKGNGVEKMISTYYIYTL